MAPSCLFASSFFLLLVFFCKLTLYFGFFEWFVFLNAMYLFMLLFVSGVGVGGGIAGSHWLSTFWHDVCARTVTLESGNIDVLLHNRERLVVRQCYLTLFQLITNMGEGCHFLILGKAGVGKSTFVLWELHLPGEGQDRRIWYHIAINCFC